MKRINNKETLYCFSPLVMIVTFTIEIMFAIYAFVKSRKASSDLGIVMALIFLAVFQLAEYQICAGSDPLMWAKVGLVSITFLPVTGLYLISKLNKKSSMVAVGIVVVITFVTLFLFMPSTVNNVTCGGNYVIFDVKESIHALYGYYYFGFLLFGIWEAMRGMKNASTEKVKKALGWFIIGYLSFILPLTLVYIFMPITRVAIASIMCGFAVVFAAILTFKIAPIYHEYIKFNKVKK